MSIQTCDDNLKNENCSEQNEEQNQFNVFKYDDELPKKNETNVNNEEIIKETDSLIIVVTDNYIK